VFVSAFAVPLPNRIMNRGKADKKRSTVMGIASAVSCLVSFHVWVASADFIKKFSMASTRINNINNNTLDNLSTLLKHNGILVIVDTNGLFSNHLPQLNETIQAWQEMEASLRLQHNYDSNAGCKLPDIIQQSTSFDFLGAQHWSDPEFAFDGPASPRLGDHNEIDIDSSSKESAAIFYIHNHWIYSFSMWGFPFLYRCPPFF
jgi:hypothetical protein